MDKIPLHAPSLDGTELDRIAEVMKSGWLTMGKVTEELEKKIEAYLGVKHAIGIHTGTSALHVALESLDFEPGDEVIAPSLTYAATIQAIVMAGGTPAFADVQPDTLNLCPSDLKRRITDRTRAVMPVHYGGAACDMDAIREAIGDRGIVVVEDAAHAFGSTYKGKMVGSISEMTCFSFGPLKTLTCGEGGAVVTNDDELAAKIRRMRTLGVDRDTWRRYGLSGAKPWEYWVSMKGFRYHLPNLNAAIGLAQFEKLEGFIRNKREAVGRYDAAFAGLEGVSLLRRPLEEMSPFNYTFRVPDQEALLEKLLGQGIGAGVNYPPNHLQPFFENQRTELPETEKAGRDIVTLPMFNAIGREQTDRVIETVLKHYAG